MAVQLLLRTTLFRAWGADRGHQCKSQRPPASKTWLGCGPSLPMHMGSIFQDIRARWHANLPLDTSPIHRLGTFIPGLATQLHLPPSVAPMGLVSSHANTHANANRLRFRCLLGSAIPVKAVANVAELIWLDVAMRRCSTPGSLFTASRGGMTPSTPFRDRVERPHGSRSG